MMRRLFNRVGTIVLLAKLDRRQLNFIDSDGDGEGKWQGNLD